MNDFKKVGDLSAGVVESISISRSITIQVKPSHHPETAFIAAFRKLAIKKGMLVCPVPDPKGNYEYQNYRPFDFVLITKDNVFCIEAKVNHNSLLSHQKGTAAEIEKINSMAYWVIRKHETVKRGTMYSVEKFIDNKMKVICESDVLAHIVQHFEIVKGWE